MKYTRHFVLVLPLLVVVVDVGLLTAESGRGLAAGDLPGSVCQGPAAEAVGALGVASGPRRSPRASTGTTRRGALPQAQPEHGLRAGVARPRAFSAGLAGLRPEALVMAPLPPGL